MTTPRHLGVVCDFDGTITATDIGTMLFEVDPDYRRQGIALRLVQPVGERLRHWGMKWTTALVEREHPWAVGFWYNNGYELDPRVVRYVRNFDVDPGA